jgi:hypothetical protein
VSTRSRYAERKIHTPINPVGSSPIARAPYAFALLVTCRHAAGNRKSLTPAANDATRI